MIEDEDNIFGNVAVAPKIQSSEQVKKPDVTATVAASKPKAQVAEKVSSTATPKRDYAAEYDAQIGSLQYKHLTVFPEIKPLVGFEQYWANLYPNGQFDGANFQRKKAKGYVIRPIESIEDYDWRSDERNVSGEFGGLSVNGLVLMHRKISVGDQVRKNQLEETAKRGYEELTKARKKGGVHLDVESENNARVGGRRVTPSDDE